MVLLVEDVDKTPVIPIDRIELVGLRFIKDPRELNLYLDFSDEPTSRPKVGFLLSNGDDDYLEIDMDTRLPFSLIPDTTIKLSEVLTCLWSCGSADSVEDIFARICAEMVLTVIKIKIELIYGGKVLFTCMVFGYEGQATCDLVDVRTLVEVIP